MDNSERYLKLEAERNFQQKDPSKNNTMRKPENFTKELNNGIMNIESKKRLETEATNIGALLSAIPNNIDKELKEINRMIDEGLLIHDDSPNIISSSETNSNNLNIEGSETNGYNRNTENVGRTNISFENISEKFLEKDYLLIWLADIFLSIHVGLEIRPTFQEVRKRASKLEREFENRRNKSGFIVPRDINYSEDVTSPTEIHDQTNDQLKYMERMRCNWCGDEGHGIINCVEFAIKCHDFSETLKYRNQNGGINRMNQRYFRQNHNHRNLRNQHIPNRRINRYSSNIDNFQTYHNINEDQSGNKNNYITNNQIVRNAGRMWSHSSPNSRRYNSQPNHEENSFLESVGSTSSIATDQTRVGPESPNRQ